MGVPDWCRRRRAHRGGERQGEPVQPGQEARARRRARRAQRVGTGCGAGPGPSRGAAARAGQPAHICLHVCVCACIHSQNPLTVGALGVRELSEPPWGCPYGAAVWAGGAGRRLSPAGQRQGSGRGAPPASRPPRPTGSSATCSPTSALGGRCFVGMSRSSAEVANLSSRKALDKGILRVRAFLPHPALLLCIKAE